MNNEEKYKETLVGAFDSELVYQEIAIPDGFEATIEDKKIILKRKESEDERIKKNIIGYINGISISKYEVCEATKDSWIAWLEKQGEHDNFLSKIQVGDKVTRNEDGALVNLSRLERMAKPADKQGEQKPTDETEPKFHEGDFIIYNNDICQIVKREEGCNKLVTIFGIEKELVNERNLSTARLWTINDAKDGDVLAAHECLVLFKEIDGLNIRCHCTYHYLGFSPSFHVNTLQNKDAFHPATKEQRDTLFTKMHEAGFEWDEKTRELKEIEEEYDGEDYGIDSLFHAQRILEKTLGKVNGYQTDDGILEHKCAISAVKKLYRKKFAWSEEDDYNLQCMIAKAVNDIQNGNVGRNQELIDWLKSLKDRVRL